MNNPHWQAQTNAIGTRFILPSAADTVVSYQKGDLVWWHSDPTKPLRIGPPTASQ